MAVTNHLTSVPITAFATPTPIKSSSNQIPTAQPKENASFTSLLSPGAPARTNLLLGLASQIKSLATLSAPTTKVAYSANLNANEFLPSLLGGVSADMDQNDSVNTDNHPSTLILPTATDSLTPGDTFHIAVSNGTKSTYTYGGFASSRDVTSGSGILDANGPSGTTDAFLGYAGTSGFSSSALNFTITTPATGTVTFTYTPTSPETQLGQSNNLTSLSSAISQVPGLTSRVANGRLYVGATDANAAVTFGNGDSTGTAGPPPLAGIDWVGQLGLSNVPQNTGSSQRYSSLQSLVNDINAIPGLAATLVPITPANISLSIKASNPIVTLDLSDGTGNTGSPLAALGLVPSLQGGPPPATPATTGLIGPSYDPADPSKNMASGAVQAQYSCPITVFDSKGVLHALNVAFLKTNTNTWAVEIYSQPATDVSHTDGQVASGTMTFNGDGSLCNYRSGIRGVPARN
jgi:hypothetical protein